MNRRTVDEACTREREMNMANNSDDTYGMREDDDDDGETSNILSSSLDSVWYVHTHNAIVWEINAW